MHVYGIAVLNSKLDLCYFDTTRHKIFLRTLGKVALARLLSAAWAESSLAKATLRIAINKVKIKIIIR